MKICLLLSISLFASTLFAKKNIVCLKKHAKKYANSYFTITQKNNKQGDTSNIYIDSLTIISALNINAKTSIDKITIIIDSCIEKMPIPYFYRLGKDKEIHSPKEKVSDYYEKKGDDLSIKIKRVIYPNVNLSEYQTCGYFDLKTAQPLLIYFIVLQEQSDMNSPPPPYEVYNYFFKGQLVKKIRREFHGYYSSDKTVTETTWYYNLDKVIITKIKSTKQINQPVFVNNLSPFEEESTNQNTVKNGITKLTLDEFKNCKEKSIRTEKEMIEEIKALKKKSQTSE